MSLQIKVQLTFFYAQIFPTNIPAFKTPTKEKKGLTDLLRGKRLLF